jgi:uncharacterized protein YqcC (DUF446 family)
MNTSLHEQDAYQRAGELIAALEQELHRLERWSAEPLPASAFENMGAFGANTMTFEQWLQFVLMPRLREIIAERGEFPQGSMLASYAVRALDGDADSENLQALLRGIDDLVEHANAGSASAPAPEPVPESPHPSSNTVTLGDTKLPSVVYTLAGVLPQYAFDDLEGNLQTFDSFLEILSPTVRPELANLLMKAASHCSDPRCQARIETAARSIAWGKRAAEPYNHEEAMKRYVAEHKKNFEDRS